MNNNINRFNKELAQTCLEYIKNHHDAELIEKLSYKRPTKQIKISRSALSSCLENHVIPYDYFILPGKQLKKKYGDYFDTKVVGIYSPSNEELVKEMMLLYQQNTEKILSKYHQLLNKQAYGLISLEESLHPDLVSEFIPITDLWLTPTDVIDKFFEVSGLCREECLDPCASDGRWLQGKGYSLDILPMASHVHQQDFLTFSKEQMPTGIKTIVGNLPFSLTDEFVEKALSLTDDCYFLVNGDTIFNHFPDHIKHLYILTGIEGKQKDNRSRCEFDVPFLIKSALWCCIVHITKEKQEKWIVEKNLSNQVRRDGYHVALGRNVFIHSEVKVDQNPRITQIPVKSSIDFKGGKKITLDGETIDLRNFSYLNG